MNLVLATKTTEGHKVYSPSLLVSFFCLPFFWDCSHQISWLLHFRSVSTYIDDSAVGRGTTLQRSNSDFDYSRPFQDYWELIVSNGEKENGTRLMKIWHHMLHRIHGQRETILCYLKSPLSPFVLCCVPPLLSCLSAFSVFTLKPTALTSQESYKCSEWIM